MIDAHTFKIQDAIIHGVEKAVLLYNFEYWLTKNKANMKNVHDGYVWTFNTANSYSELFPYMSAKKIARLLKELEECGALISGNYNKVAYDRTKWYTTPNYAISQNEEMEFSELENRISKIEPPIPNNYQINTDNKDHVKATPKRAKFLFSEDDMKTASWMFGRIKEVMPSTKQPNLESWANTIRLMNKSDKHSHSEICHVFNWANKDSFWYKNILSPEKLRKQFDRLSAEAGKRKETITPAQTKQQQETNINNELNQLFGVN